MNSPSPPESGEGAPEALLTGNDPDAARLGTYEWDILADRITWSSGHQRLWGYADGEFDGTFDGFTRRVHPEDLPGVRDTVARCIASRAPYDDEFRILRPDGTVRWVHSRGEFSFDGDRPSRMRGVVADITGRKRADAALRLSDERFRLVSLATNDAVWDWDIVNGTLWWNEGFQTLYGYRPEDIEPGLESWTTRLHPDDSEHVKRSLADAIAGGGRSWSSEYRFRRSDGAYADILDRGFIIRDAGGAAVRMVGAMIDLTARKQAEERIRQLNRVYAVMTDINQAIVRVREPRALLETACRIAVETGGFLMAWIGLLDETTLTIRAHAGADAETLAIVTRLIGARREETCAFTHAALETGRSAVCNDIAGDAQASLWRDAAMARGYRAMAALPLSLGGRVVGTFNLYASQPGFFDADELRLLEDLAADISFCLELDARDQERALLENQFRQAQKMETVGRLAGGIAHDFNNLLTVISSTADLAAEAVQPDSPLLSDLEQITAAAARAADLTSQLLALGRQQILKPEVINLSHIAKRMEGMLRRVIGEDVELRLELAPDPGSIKADPGQIEQVILNLAVNARDAMPDGGTLTIETAGVPAGAASDPLMRDAPYVMVAVRDSGSGITEAVRDRMFEPFFTTKEIGKGTGLGLSTVYGIVEQSGGHISVSTEPGRGSVFRLFFPRVDDVAEPVRVQPVTTPCRGTETILLVEDERALRSLGRRILASAGYRVLEAESGEDAIAVLAGHEEPVHLLLTDVVMPGMNGRELADRLKAERPAMRVLYTSGHTTDAIFRHGVLDDPRRFLAKPYRPAQLKAKVRELLDE